MVQLEALTRLTNLLHDSDEGAEFARRLQDVANWFTEGFDTPQFAAAQAALSVS